MTPRWLLGPLGRFDLDPCAPQFRPWDTADQHLSAVQDGLSQPWAGRVWLSPPYGRQTQRWVARLAGHGEGTALLLARTDARWWHDHVFDAAHAMLFLRGRVSFCLPDGRRSDENAGAASVLVAYGEEDARILAAAHLPGRFVGLHSDVNDLGGPNG